MIDVVICVNVIYWNEYYFLKVIFIWVLWVDDFEIENNNNYKIYVLIFMNY